MCFFSSICRMIWIQTWAFLAINKQRFVIVNDKPFDGVSDKVSEYRDKRFLLLIFEYEEGGHSIVRSQWRSFNTIARCFLIVYILFFSSSYVFTFLFCINVEIIWVVFFSVAWNVTCAWYVYRNVSLACVEHARVRACMRIVCQKFVYENDHT